MTSASRGAAPGRAQLVRGDQREHRPARREELRCSAKMRPSRASARRCSVASAAVLLERRLEQRGREAPGQAGPARCGRRTARAARAAQVSGWRIEQVPAAPPGGTRTGVARSAATPDRASSNGSASAARPLKIIQVLTLTSQRTSRSSPPQLAAAPGAARREQLPVGRPDAGGDERARRARSQRRRLAQRTRP